MENERLINEFIAGINRGPFKCLKNCGEAAASEYVVENSGYDDIYTCAVEQAWLDVCRTVTTKDNEEKTFRIKKAASDSIRAYFDGQPKDSIFYFDNWFLSVMSVLKKIGAFTVGQSQKLINMAFKYLYCCGDIREKKNAHFTCCHMPLDGRTLGWYKTNHLKRGERVPDWSKIEFPDDYLNIVNGIRHHLSKHPKYDGVELPEQPLLADFCIWPGETRKKQLKELKAALKRAANDRDFCSQLTEGDIEEINSLVNTITGRN